MALNVDRRDRLRQLLREARHRAGLRQLDVATRLHKPQSYVAKIESGERGIDVVEAIDMCKAIGVSIHEVIDSIDT